MSNLLVLGLLKAAADQKAASNTRARSANAARTAKSGERYSYAGSSYEKTYSSEEHLYKVVEGDEELKKFFDLVYGKAKELEEIAKTRELLEIQGMLKESADKNGEIESVKRELAEMGIDISADTSIRAGSLGVEGREGHGFGGVGKYGHNPATFPTTFNGIEVTPEHLKNDGKNPYEGPYKTSRAANENLELAAEDCEKEIKAKELLLMFSPVGRKKAKEDLKELEARLADIRLAQNDGAEKKKRMDAYVALTPEQKAKIKEYYDLIEDFKPLGQEVAARMNDRTQRDVRYGKYKEPSNSLWEQAIEALKETGEITDADISQAEGKISEVDLSQTEYEEGIDKSLFAMGKPGYTALVNYFGNRAQLLDIRQELAASRAELDRVGQEEKMLDDEIKTQPVIRQSDDPSKDDGLDK